MLQYHQSTPQTPGETQRQGKVYLVGAGPGDPDLITVKGLRCLRQADVVVYDRLASPELLHEVRSDARLVFVGKEPGCHTLPQEEINRLLIEFAGQGQAVVRLKGGDPFVFGRGGEEALALKAAGIAFEVVPGVSSAIAVPAYAGIPITQRRQASSFTVVTGHKENGNEVDWEALARLKGTLIVLMGVKALPDFTRRLIQGGLTATTPAAVIQEGTIAHQRTISGTLENIAERALEAGLSSPAITIIGSVVDLHEALDWYRSTNPAGQDA
ncbi:MAG: uroporphyrinogen-III C-methyltransferase [Ktedonobacteraceae bacterium]|nr:uroporphyrinogen-III C-methyltransferase [Ktedonobacteraceae bacterium]